MITEVLKEYNKIAKRLCLFSNFDSIIVDNITQFGDKIGNCDLPFLKQCENLFVSICIFSDEMITVNPQ